MKTTLIRVSTLALVLGLLGGCAATPQQISDIRDTAQQALDTANAASKQSSNALSTANDALATARKAQSAADNALDCCNTNSSKIDRMFEKAMRK
ncbi:MAG: Lpp/OprI family alanine-zipper lipoprotein [Gammaproteobacteria bacterium]|jgi:ABC-type transporter Mla subunit MlaD